MQKLLVGVVTAVIPFLTMYLFWVSSFAVMSSTLGANKSNAEGYTDLTTFIGYFMVTFENSIGNINSPSIDFLKDRKEKPTFLDNLCIGLIYFFWWIA